MIPGGCRSDHVAGCGLKAPEVPSTAPLLSIAVRLLCAQSRQDVFNKLGIGRLETRESDQIYPSLKVPQHAEVPPNSEAKRITLYFFAISPVNITICY
jgi:hypothetical protein